MSGVATLLLSLLIFQKLGAAVRWFAVMMWCIVIWAISYGFELASGTMSQMLFWVNLEYIGISFLPSTWIMFMIRFIGKEEWLTRKNIALIFSFPALALFFVWTNEWHHIHYAAVSLDDTGTFPLLAITPGPWYRVHTVYFYFMLGWGAFLLVRRFYHADMVYKRQNRVILIGAFIPWTVNFLYLLGLRPHSHIDLTPYAFILTSAVIGIGLLRFSLFDIVPLAREKVIDGMTEGMLVLDAGAKVIDLNAAMRKFLPQGTVDPVGKPLTEVLPAEKELHEIVSDKLPGRLEIKFNDGTADRYVEVATTSLFEKKTIYSGSLLLFWDITERKRAENKLREQADELDKLNRLKDQIFTIISHDLRTPLVGLISMLSIVEEAGLTEEEFRFHVQELSKNVGYSVSLLENLLTWSRSQLAGEHIAPQQFDLMSVIDEKILLYERKASEKGILLKNEIGKGTFLYADRNMVQTVVHNLIANALKFCKEGDHITVCADRGPEETIVCVKDTGIGMNGDIYDKIFTADMVTTLGTNNEKGTGLGLKLCKEFIEKNNGRIWVETAEGAGSSFYFALSNRPPGKAE